MKKERRIINSTLELRQEGENERIVGYGATFDKLSEPIWDLFQEKISPGAFKRAIQISDTRSLMNHDPNLILGRKLAQTLELSEDSNGLWYEVMPGTRTYELDLIQSLRRRDISQSSFGFTVLKEEWDESGDMPIRTIVEVEYLYDVGPVTFPAYASSTSGMRSLDTIDNAKIVFEQFKAIRSGNSELEILKRRLELLEQM